MTRAGTLQADIIGRLESALSISTDNVIPVQIVQQSDDLDPRVAVGASLDSTDRNGIRQPVAGTGRVIVDGTQSYAKENGVLSLTQLQGSVIDELTAHSENWRATGLSDETEVAWDDDLNRYLGATQFSFERIDPHPQYK